MNSEEVSVIESTQNLKSLMAGFIDPEIYSDLSILRHGFENDGTSNGTKIRILSYLDCVPLELATNLKDNVVNILSTKDNKSSSNDHLTNPLTTTCAIDNNPKVEVVVKVSRKCKTSLANMNYSFHSKSKRTALSRAAKSYLEHAFQIKPFPNRKDIEILATKLKLKDTQVRTWFNNKRMRIKLKQQQPPKLSLPTQ